ncbi:hypothetical protein KSW81_003221 [Nannochloris sp. 'desiccata']|nr:hypothetical protein KSW81_003221 [Chlorella desiccata (nom. nud.)]
MNTDSNAAMSDPVDDATGCNPRQRFQLELEFVQCLASPHYLNFLAQSRYLDDPAFLAFLEYLKYWKQPEYARFILYPHAIYFLDLLQQADFRRASAHPAILFMVALPEQQTKRGFCPK